MAVIDHVVVLALDGRSFDHMLGFLDHPDPERFDGLTGGPYSNTEWTEGALVAAEATAKPVLPLAPGESHVDVMEQLAVTVADRSRAPSNIGFVANYERTCRGPSPPIYGGLLGRLRNRGADASSEADGSITGRGPLIMRCQQPAQVPVLSTLALEFAVCTRWFCSVPGPAWPNRNFMHAATSDGDVGVFPRWYADRTIFELLEEHGKSWYIYHDDAPQVWAFPRLWDTVSRHAQWFPSDAFAQHAAAGDLPAYSFIEPNHRSNSQHPGNNLVPDDEYDTFSGGADTDFARAETLIATVYEALRANPAIFERTVLLITYDTHGGFYDHVPPPVDVPSPGQGFVAPRVLRRIWRRKGTAFDFAMLGPRVPAIVVSPYIAAGTVDTETRDHASIPATLRAIFAPDASPLTARDAWAPSFHSVLRLVDPRRADLPDLSAYAHATTLHRPTAGAADTLPDHYQSYAAQAVRIVRRMADFWEPEAATVPLAGAPIVEQARYAGLAFAQAAQRHREQTRTRWPYTIDLDRLFDQALATVVADPDIVEQLRLLQQRLDPAAAIGSKRAELLSSIVAQEERARNVEARLQRLLIASDSVRLEEHIVLLEGADALGDAVRNFDENLPAEGEQPSAGAWERLADWFLRIRPYRLDLEAWLDDRLTGDQKAKRRPRLGSSVVDAARAAGPSANLISEVRAEAAECRRVIAEIEQRELNSAQPRGGAQREFNSLVTEWRALRRDISQSLESGMLSAVLVDINAARSAETAPVMRVAAFGRLRGTPPPEEIVTTAAFERLEAMIRERTGGSFGIAGPRGVGKTTLIHRFAQGAPLEIPELDAKGITVADRPRRGVVVSAPVVYQAQDFVLHLYASLCERLAGSDREEPIDPQRELARARGRGRLLPESVRIGLIAYGSGSVTGGFGLLGLAGYRRASGASASLLGLPDVGAGLLTLAAVLLGLLLGSTASAAIVRRSSPVTAMAGADNNEFPIVGPRVVRYGAALTSALTVAGAMVLLVVDGWYGQSWDLVGGLALLATGGAVLWTLRRVTWVAKRIARLIEALADGRAAEPQAASTALLRQPSHDPELREVARRHLLQIQFQQTFSSERSAGLKISGPSAFPLSIDATGKRGATWAERAKTYPELVADLLDFLTTAGKVHELIIGVDELDKLRSAHDVENFLNDIKGVFGATGCFFLVSVSEDAAAGFARRGTPFRDVFDSSFNDVITLRHLDLASARKILHGLLGGWTEPFVGLCYVLSGGLARDLYRATNELITFRNADNEIELTQAALELCRREGETRVHAVRHELMREPFDAASLDLLNRIADLDAGQATATTFMQWHDALHTWATATTPPAPATTTTPADSPAARTSAAVRLALELAAYMLFAATVLDFFTPATIADKFTDSESTTAGPKSLAALATARQCLALSPRISLAVTERFRKEWGLEDPGDEYPR